MMDGWIISKRNSSWEFSSQIIRKEDLDEDLTSTASQDEYLQFAVINRSYRKHTKRFFKSGVLSRLRRAGRPLLGVNGSFISRELGSNLSLKLYGSTFFQQILSSSQAVDWAALLKSSLSYSRRIVSRLSNTMSMAAYFRFLSIDGSKEIFSSDDGDEGKGVDLSNVDQDIYTSYKEDHKRGIKVAYTLNYRPWRDFYWLTGANFFTNREMNPFKIDNYGVRTGCHLLYNPFQFGLGFNFYHYLADNNRDTAELASKVRAEIIWSRWLRNQDRVQVGFNTSYVFENKKSFGQLFVRYHLSGDRQLQDYGFDGQKFYHLKRLNRYKYKD